jgi:RNA polymerase sigma-70 factor (ECF subfamily)
MSEPSMHDLAARLACGDEAAFAELYDGCADRLHAYLVSRLGCRDTASDVMQSAFLRAVKSRRQFRSVENPIAYVFQIARNEAIRALAKERRRNENTPNPVEPFAVADAKYEDAEVVTAALGSLSAENRELVELKIYSGLTFAEISQIVARPQATVATQYRRALESLRGWVTKQFR